MNKNIVLSLRKLHGRLYEWRLDKKTRFSLLKTIMQHRVVILGTPEHGNLGDNAIVVAMYSFLDYCGIPKKKIAEITYSEYELIEQDLKRIPKVKKLILGVGGGNFGDLWYNEQEMRESIILHFKKCPILIFPQTVLYLDQKKLEHSIEVFQTAKRLGLCARDRKSFEIMNDCFAGCSHDIIAVPDIVLFLDAARLGLSDQGVRDGVLLCMRRDKEKSVDDAMIDGILQLLDSFNIKYSTTDTVIEKRTSRETRLEIVQSKIREFMLAELVITDRLHGMVFAAITGTPCIVFGNNHHKVSGTYDWIKDLPYIRFFEEIPPSPEDIRELLTTKENQYDRSRLMRYYDQLKNLLLEYLGVRK